MSSLEKLLSISSTPLCGNVPKIDGSLLTLAGTLSDGLIHMLEKRNGFYAFENALHVFPTCSLSKNEIDLYSWNDETLWRGAYEGLADACLFFAEDIFGGQFCVKEGEIFTFEPETGTLDYLAKDIKEWAELIMDDYEVLTGYPLACQWQKQYGRLFAKKRLLPKIPFVLGGEFNIDNLFACDSIEGMNFRGYLANQIKSLPDGSKIKIEITD